jgi:xanthine dehydrogenase large subunit
MNARPHACGPQTPRESAPSRRAAPASRRVANGRRRLAPHESAAPRWPAPPPTSTTSPRCKGTLHAAPILSTVAHGRCGRGRQAALAMPGVRGVVLAGRHPRRPDAGRLCHDEPIFAIDTVQHIGQVVGLVVADTVMQARRAARKVKLDIDPCPPC